MKFINIKNIKLNYARTIKRPFSGYTGKHISDKDLVKKNDDWYVNQYTNTYIYIYYLHKC